MYLKKIELHGFKSFADKVNIEFQPGITGIVGPNGCGKSNISDAVRWVLGEQSVKSLRGSNMADVIFAGSQDRRAQNLAEVTLIFDNSDRMLNYDYNEVEITRRLYRQGNEAEYLLNRQQCRLKDITDLLLDTGLGRDSLSIISQGNISNFADSRPEERRVIFEEAAGVSKYKKRKIFAILLIIFTVSIGIISNFIWNIEIQEEGQNNTEEIYKDIVEAGLNIGTLKSKINSKEIINKVRLKRKDIAWMGIELKGTNAIVKIVKADAKPEIIDDTEYCNIVSDKIGVTKINAQNGTANVKVGDTVNAGTILINGWLEGKYTGIRYVHAKGEIEAKIWHTKYQFIPYNTTEIRETGNTEKFYSIKFNKFEINFKKRVSKFKIYDTIETEEKFRLFSDFYLPISVKKVVNKEQEEKQKKYNQEQAKDLGIKELEQQLDNEIEDKTKIVNKNINTYEKENGLEVYVTYEVLESIGTNEKIVF